MMPNCPDCGHYVSAEERFCGNCGNRLDIGENFGESRRPRVIQEVKKVCRRCAFCNTTGKVCGPFGMATPITHMLCGGTGNNLIPEDWQPCDPCSGTGKETYSGGITAVKKPCRHCKGTGWAPKTC
jgi:hypothetical protein